MAVWGGGGRGMIQNLRVSFSGMGYSPKLGGGNPVVGLSIEPLSVIKQTACSLPPWSLSPASPRQLHERAETEKPWASQHSRRQTSPSHTGEQGQTLPPFMRAMEYPDGASHMEAR